MKNELRGEQWSTVWFGFLCHGWRVWMNIYSCPYIYGKGIIDRYRIDTHYVLSKCLVASLLNDISRNTLLAHDADRRIVRIEKCYFRVQHTSFFSFPCWEKATAVPRAGDGMHSPHRYRFHAPSVLDKCLVARYQTVSVGILAGSRCRSKNCTYHKLLF